MSGKAEVIVLHESWRQSVCRDVTTFLTICAVFAPGIAFDSGAMQWFGFLMLMVFIGARVSKIGPRRTPQEAADFLRDKFNVVSSPKAG